MIAATPEGAGCGEDRAGVIGHGANAGDGGAVCRGGDVTDGTGTVGVAVGVATGTFVAFAVAVISGAEDDAATGSLVRTSRRRTPARTTTTVRSSTAVEIAS